MIVNNGLIQEVSDAIADAVTLEGLGGIEDEFGQVVFDKVKVICYRVFGEYEIDVITEAGAFGFDMPIGAISVKRRERGLAVSGESP